MALKREKCLFPMDRVVFMGLLLTEYGVGPTEEKVRGGAGDTNPDECFSSAWLFGPSRLQFSVFA